MKYSGISWKSADGTRTNVYDLESSHIYNIMKCLKGYGKRTIPYTYAGHHRYKWFEILEHVLNTRKPNYKQIKQLYPIY